MEELYDNIGGKIKTFAYVVFIIEALASIIFGIANMVTDDILNMGDEVGIIVGLLCIVLGPILSFASSLTLYGFGVLVEKACEIAENTKSLSVSQVQQKQSMVVQNATLASEKFEDLIQYLPLSIRDNIAFLNKIKNNSTILKILYLSDNIEYRKEVIELEYAFSHSNIDYDKYTEQKEKLLKKYGIIH